LPSYVVNSTSIHRLDSKQKDGTNAVKPRVQTHMQPFQLFFSGLQGLALSVHWAENGYGFSAGQHAVLPEGKGKG